MPVQHEQIDGVSVITIDHPPLNLLGQAVRAGLAAALDAAEAAGSTRIVLTGAGRAFAAGADAGDVGPPPAAPHLPDILIRIERLPVIAAMGGMVLGCGLELALAARVRIARSDATFGLPDVTLGMVPGAGGTQRLPRLTGIARAAALISEGREIGAAEALAAGIIDRIAEDPVAAALALPDQVLARHLPVVARPAPLPDPEAVAGARARAARRSPGQIAPLRAIDLVEAASRLPLDEGLALERATFLQLCQSEQATALRHIFLAERAAQTRGHDLPLPADISRAIVVGGGTMGAGIAYALAGSGIIVTTVETSEAAAARARATIAALYADAVRRGKIGQDQADAALAARHHLCVGFARLPEADIAIEAAFEDLAVKRQIFAALDHALPEAAILATNTSYLDVNAIFAGLRNPARALGLHFFAPAHVMKLVEIVRAAQTAPETLATAVALTQRLNKLPVEAGACEGFIGNRILTRYRQATDILMLEGALPGQIDAALEGFGMAMGPYAVQDLSGLDIAFANRQRKGGGARPGLRYIPIADRMVADLKRLGRKTGAGWYDYDGATPRPSPEVEALVLDCATVAGVARRIITEVEIRDLALLAMIEEGVQILQDGVALCPADIDLVMVHGYGFPRWRGGPMHFADRLGLPAVLSRLAALADRDPLSWRVPDLLKTLVDKGRTLASLT